MANLREGKAEMALKIGILCRALWPVRRATLALALVAIIYMKGAMSLFNPTAEHRVGQSTIAHEGRARYPCTGYCGKQGPGPAQCGQSGGPHYEADERDDMPAAQVRLFGSFLHHNYTVYISPVGPVLYSSYYLMLIIHP